MQQLNLQKKLSEYEDFVNNTLKEDLKKFESQLIVANTSLTEWYQLKNSVKTILENCPTGFKTQMNVGCNIFTEAKVNDPSVIHVHLGLGCYLTMTLEEAIKYSEMRIRISTKQVDHIRNQIIHVKSHIKMVLLAMQEIQKL